MAVFCEFENNKGDFVKVFLKNVTDPVGEFWEKKTLQMSSGVRSETRIAPHSKLF